MIYGDHYGISENHNNAMEKLLGEKITPAKFTDLNRTGFWIKVPGKSGGINKEYAGQIDVMPTILHLVGIDTKTILCLVLIYSLNNITMSYHLEMVTLSLKTTNMLMVSYILIKIMNY